MSIGWFLDREEADNYFYYERLETEAWDDADDLMKNKMLLNAYNRLYYDARWVLPTYAQATVAELVTLQKANGEMAYYLAIHLADEDRRKGIQAQGVVQAGIVKEVYSENMLMTVPVPPLVISMLTPWSADANFAAINLVRDEEEEDIFFK